MCALCTVHCTDCTELSYLSFRKNILGVLQICRLSLSAITQIILLHTGETEFSIFEFLSNLRRRLGCTEFLGYRPLYIRGSSSLQTHESAF